jgi:hypothetical protein
VIDPAIRRALAPDVFDAAVARGRGRAAVDVLAALGIGPVPPP